MSDSKISNFLSDAHGKRRQSIVAIEESDFWKMFRDRLFDRNCSYRSVLVDFSKENGVSPDDLDDPDGVIDYLELVDYEEPNPFPGDIIPVVFFVDFLIHQRSPNNPADYSRKFGLRILGSMLDSCSPEEFEQWVQDRIDSKNWRAFWDIQRLCQRRLKQSSLHHETFGRILEIATEALKAKNNSVE